MTIKIRFFNPQYSEYQFWLRWCLWGLFHSPGKTSAVLNGRECQHVTPSSNFNLNITARNISEVAAQLLTFSEFLQTTNGKVCLEKSEYHTHIGNWLKVIRRDQVSCYLVVCPVLRIVMIKWHLCNMIFAAVYNWLRNIDQAQCGDPHRPVLLLGHPELGKQLFLSCVKQTHRLRLGDSLHRP